MPIRNSAPIAERESGDYIPKLAYRLPYLIAKATSGDPENFDYPVGEYPIPDLDEQLEETE